MKVRSIFVGNLASLSPEAELYAWAAFAPFSSELRFQVDRLLPNLMAKAAGASYKSQVAMDSNFSFLSIGAAMETAAPSGPAELAVAFLTLCVLEIVLGIDNVIFISILAGKLPAHQQAKARFVGLSLAMITRVLLLLSIAWMARLTAPLFSLFQHEVSGRDLILITGGIFLVWKSTNEIHQKLEGEEGRRLDARGSFVSLCYYPDHPSGYCLLARLGDHGRRHGQQYPHYDSSRGPGCDLHDVFLRARSVVLWTGIQP